MNIHYKNIYKHCRCSKLVKVEYSIGIKPKSNIRILETDHFYWVTNYFYFTYTDIDFGCNTLISKIDRYLDAGFFSYNKI
jgi:hypothetical protein